MKPWNAVGLVATGCLIGCVASGPPLTAEGPETVERAFVPCAPLVIDRGDMRLGTTVYFSRLPDAGQIHDLTSERGLAHVVLTLDEWPDDISRLTALEAVPPEADVIVVLRGYPPSRGAVDLWKLVSARLRLVVLVTEPPMNPLTLDWLNEAPALERVIAEMEISSRAGFERLQRPLSFRRVVL